MTSGQIQVRLGTTSHCPSNVQESLYHYLCLQMAPNTRNRSQTISQNLLHLQPEPNRTKTHINRSRTRSQSVPPDLRHPLQIGNTKTKFNNPHSKVSHSSCTLFQSVPHAMQGREREARQDQTEATKGQNTANLLQRAYAHKTQVCSNNRLFLKSFV